MHMEAFVYIKIGIDAQVCCEKRIQDTESGVQQARHRQKSHPQRYSICLKKVLINLHQALTCTSVWTAALPKCSSYEQHNDCIFWMLL